MRYTNCRASSLQSFSRVPPRGRTWTARVFAHERATRGRRPLETRGSAALVGRRLAHRRRGCEALRREPAGRDPHPRAARERPTRQPLRRRRSSRPPAHLARPARGRGDSHPGQPPPDPPRDPRRLATRRIRNIPGRPDERRPASRRSAAAAASSSSSEGASSPSRASASAASTTSAVGIARGASARAASSTVANAGGSAIPTDSGVLARASTFVASRSASRARSNTASRNARGRSSIGLWPAPGTSTATAEMDASRRAREVNAAAPSFVANRLAAPRTAERTPRRRDEGPRRRVGMRRRRARDEKGQGRKRKKER